MLLVFLPNSDLFGKYENLSKYENEIICFNLDTATTDSVCK
jgi:hypothetical protein